MEVLKPQLNLDNFFARLRQAPKRVLMLDYDGTLAPFRPERDKAVPYPRVREILRRIIAASKTRLVVVSGRPVDDLAPLLGLDTLPEIWGCHGWEHWRNGKKYQQTPLDERTRQGLAEAEKWAEEENLSASCERKPCGIAFHWRGKSRDEVDRLKAKIEKKWLSTASRFGLILQEFDGGLELRVAGVTKAAAVNRIIQEAGTEAVIAYLGDDLTDEDAFRALSGHGLSVLVRPDFRPTAADLWLKPPKELIVFLEKWIEHGG
jgi:trehalose-phosphatase